MKKNYSHIIDLIVFDMLFTIENAEYRGSQTVQLPATPISKAIAKILIDLNLIENVTKEKEGMNIFLILSLVYKYKTRYEGEGGFRPSFLFQRVGTPSLPVYCRYSDILISSDNGGVLLLWTGRGLMTDRQVHQKKINGILKIICYLVPLPTGIS